MGGFAHWPAADVQTSRSFSRRVCSKIRRIPSGMADSGMSPYRTHRSRLVSVLSSIISSIVVTSVLSGKVVRKDGVASRRATPIGHTAWRGYRGPGPETAQSRVFLVCFHGSIRQRRGATGEHRRPAVIQAHTWYTAPRRTRDPTADPGFRETARSHPAELKRMPVGPAALA